MKLVWALLIIYVLSAGILIKNHNELIKIQTEGIRQQCEYIKFQAKSYDLKLDKETVEICKKYE